MWKRDKQFNLALRHILCVTHLVGNATSNAFNETYTRSRDGIQSKIGLHIKMPSVGTRT